MTPSRTPVIGIPTRQVQSGSQPPRLCQNRAYVRAVTRAGGAPLLIPEGMDEHGLRAVYDRCDGVLLAGGKDVDPAHYGEALHTESRLAGADEDRQELALARWAVDEGKPLLAICRGIQVLDVALGGSLYQDLAAELPGSQKHDWYPGFARNRLSHAVDVVEGSLLSELVGAGSLLVNSLHHQAVRAVAPRLVVSAKAPDGVIEGVEAPEHLFALGVQWHPEELAGEDPRAQRLFEALVEACRK